MREFLKEKRTKKDLTMRQVAEKAGISESYYCCIENGSRGAPVATAKKIAKVLGVKWTKFYE